MVTIIFLLTSCTQNQSLPSDKILDLSKSYQKLLDLHNYERQKEKLFLFVPNDILTFYAQDHAEVMAKKNSLYHSNIDNLLDKFGYVGENIAFGQENEESVVESWMNSSGHRANILNKQFKKIGFGLAIKNNHIYWVTVFSN